MASRSPEAGAGSSEQCGLGGGAASQRGQLTCSPPSGSLACPPPLWFLLLYRAICRGLAGTRAPLYPGVLLFQGFPAWTPTVAAMGWGRPARNPAPTPKEMLAVTASSRDQLVPSANWNI